jgi:myo-inositol-1(or 4)-monophosphatase
MPLAVEAADIAADLLRTTRPGALTAKGDRDMASAADYLVEREVRHFLTSSAPGIGFLGEEQGRTGNTDVFWALDPIDGTANFVRAIPLCAISLALVEGNRPVIGVVSLPFLDATYTAERSHGAYRHGERLRANTTTNLRNGIVAIGDYAVGKDADRKNRLRLAVTQRLAERAQRVRMLGSAAVDLAWVAEGRLDASITLSNKPWDTAAGTLLAEEAGAQVVDRDGSPHTIRSAATIAAPPELLSDLLALIQEAASQIRE